jgi:hypothetical protein
VQLARPVHRVLKARQELLASWDQLVQWDRLERPVRKDQQVQMALLESLDLPDLRVRKDRPE